MKKVLFISYNYPYGKFGASTLCTYRIMKALVNSGKVEVHCLSYVDNGNQSYDSIPGVHLHSLGIKCPNKRKSVFDNFLGFLMYPLRSILSDYKHYRLSKSICKSEKFDMVIAQCYPEQSVIAATLLKKRGYINNLMVIFWDNLYGKLTSKLPVKYAIWRQKIVESFVAKYANTLISLYPIKSFHEEYGDVCYGIGKRIYLGIPSVVEPVVPQKTSYDDILDNSRISVLYSGSIIRKDLVDYAVQLFNQCSFAEDVSLFFFSRGIPDEEFARLRDVFKGSIYNFDYIPLSELYSLYSKVDIFLSLPGNPRSICSKCYEYMSYGHPMVLFYDDNADVNVTTFVTYPLTVSIDARVAPSDNVESLEQFIKNSIGKSVPFEMVKNLFKSDSASAYVDLILERL